MRHTAYLQAGPAQQQVPLLLPLLLLTYLLPPQRGQAQLQGADERQSLLLRLAGERCCRGGGAPAAAAAAAAAAADVGTLKVRSCPCHG